jgi:hypothetical protein
VNFFYLNLKDREVKMTHNNFLEKETVDDANDVDLDKYTFLERMSAKKGLYCFKVRQAKR